MSLANGKVTRRKSRELQIARGVSLAGGYYKGTGGGGAGGVPAVVAGAGVVQADRRSTGGRGGQGRGGAERARSQAAGIRSRPAQPGDGEEVTIPEVTEYIWNKKGSLLAYTVSSNDATKDGAFCRWMQRRHRDDAALRQGTLRSRRVRRSGHSRFVSSATRPSSRSRSRRIGSTTGKPAKPKQPNSYRRQHARNAKRNGRRR